MAEANIFLVLVGITILFFVLLIIKEFIKKKIKREFCVICAAVALTWISLLVLYFLKVHNNTIIIALLLGQTVVGIFYLVEQKVKKELRLFRLPLLLTLTLIAYSIIKFPADVISNLILLAGLWIAFLFMYSYQKNRALRGIIKKIIDCCKKW